MKRQFHPNFILCGDQMFESEFGAIELGAFIVVDIIQKLQKKKKIGGISVDET